MSLLKIAVKGKRQPAARVLLSREAAGCIFLGES
jgi:hypothetical protein